MKSNVRNIVVAVLLAGGTTTVVGAPAWAAPQPGGMQMNPDEQLNPGQRLTSPNGLNTLVMEPNGSLVEYIPGGLQVWSSGSSVPQSIFLAQNDGNFVVIAPGNQPEWATGTAGDVDEGNVLQIQDDRNVVVYAPGHVAIWSNHMAAGS